jgi:malate dehydrogenase
MTLKLPLKKIAVTGGGGQIAYSLLFRIANGDLLGSDQPIALHILEIPSQMQVLEGVKMELQDGAYPLLQEICIGSNPFELFEGIDLALLIGAAPRGPGMERNDLLAVNGKIFIEQGRALNEVANPDVRVFVVGNPCNTNCLIALHHAPKIAPTQFYAMTRLDQNRAVFQIAAKAGVEVTEVSPIIIWGNHSSTQVPDFYHAKIKDKPVVDVIQDKQWLENEFISQVQKRGAAVIGARGKSSAASAAQALIDSVKEVWHPTGQPYSLSVFSKGNPYGIDENLIFSFPCRSKRRGEVEIISGYDLNDFLRTRIKISENELIEERGVG